MQQSTIQPYSIGLPFQSIIPSQSLPSTNSASQWKYQLAEEVKEIYNGSPSERAYQHFTEDAIFQDPPTKCVGLGEIKSNFNSLPILFSKYGLEYYRINPDFAPNEIQIEMHTTYVTKVLHKPIRLHSALYLRLNEQGKVYYMEEQWNNQPNQKEETFAGKIMQAIRRGNAKMVHKLISEQPPESAPLTPPPTQTPVVNI
eukprot:TRINITY_DN15623_c0_g1_i1.p1 TRINITY_DN15623_c0_g1~~TRINITY_DN15623_c0_g1_i1.p1  ORF type:complete len:200 (-),score=51.15 TRINITY_DN15623_c0_g1_i1:48-647(-)